MLPEPSAEASRKLLVDQRDLERERAAEAVALTAAGRAHFGVRLGSLTLLRLGRIEFASKYFHAEVCSQGVPTRSNHSILVLDRLG